MDDIYSEVYLPEEDYFDHPPLQPIPRQPKRVLIREYIPVQDRVVMDVDRKRPTRVERHRGRQGQLADTCIDLEPRVTAPRPEVTLPPEPIVERDDEINVQKNCLIIGTLTVIALGAIWVIIILHRM